VAQTAGSWKQGKEIWNIFFLVCVRRNEISW
jgi:hypothetical protein